MDKNSKPYIEGLYQDLFDSAEAAEMAAEDVVLYSQSLARVREIKSGFDYQYKIGREEGREEGMALGANHEREVMAGNMKKMGYDIESIAAITGLSTDKIQSL